MKNHNLKSVSLAVLFILLIPTAFVHASPVIVAKYVWLPRVTTVRTQLINSLNGFLSQVAGANQDNQYVLPSDLLETSDLIDEMRHMHESREYHDTDFYKTYLENAIHFNDSTYLIQLAYMGVNKDTPILRASFTLIAKKRGDRFFFNTPLKMNTAGWKTARIGNATVHYKDTFDVAKAKIYFNRVSKYDKKLHAPKKIQFYTTDNFHHALQLLGVDYKLDYNAYVHNILVEHDKDCSISVDGMLTPSFASFDPHDLWHERLHNMVSTSIINRPVDEGAAYLYGGSWGLTWQQILDKFKAFAKANPHADWLALYNDNKKFYDSAESSPLFVAYAINALIIKEIAHKKGFPAVMPLMTCGKQEKGNDNYFTALNEAAGINKKNFNARIQRLIKQS